MNDYNLANEDWVSRQAAIDVMCELMHHWFGGDPKDEIREIKRELEKLPSAHPSFPQRHENDCISRAGAINAVRDNESENYITINNLIDKDVAVALLENLPPAQQEPSESEDITFWKKRAREYEEMVLKLTNEMARGIKIDSVLITEEGIVFKKEKPEQRWISCKERLPEKEERAYWVCLEDGSQCQCRWTSSRYGFGAIRWSWHVMDKPQYIEIVAWRELPEPWKEGEADD